MELAAKIEKDPYYNVKEAREHEEDEFIQF